MVYTCLRCAYMTNVKCNLDRHNKRKIPCLYTIDTMIGYDLKIISNNTDGQNVQVDGKNMEVDGKIWRLVKNVQTV